MPSQTSHPHRSMPPRQAPDAGFSSPPVDGGQHISRRSVLGAGSALVVSLLAAACAPTRAWPTNPGARANGVGRLPRRAVNADQGDDLDQPESVTPVARAAGAKPTAPPLPPTVTAPDALPAVPECAGKAAEAASGRDQLTVASAAGTVQFLHGWTGPSTPLIETMMADFGARHPNIEIESEPLQPGVLTASLVTTLAGGSPPNAVMLRSDSAPYFAEQNALLPLDDWMARDQVRPEHFAPRELAARTWDGRIFGLPHVALGAEQLLFVNIGLLARLGHDPATPITSWRQITELIEPALRIGALALDPTRCGGGVPAWQVWAHANGGRWLDDTARRIMWAEPAAREAVSWVRELVWAQRGVPGVPPVGERPDNPLSVPEWAAEKHVCCVQDVGWILQLEKLAPHLSFAVYELPCNGDAPASDGRAPTFGGWMLAIPREARDQAAAWEWLKFATPSPAADQLAAEQGRPSALAASPDDTHAVRASSWWPTVTRSRERSVQVPSLPVSAHLDDIARAAQAEIIERQRPPQAEIEAAARAAQAVLDAWQVRRKRGVG